MEQKRTLWIIAAVGLFLVVVLGGALMVTAPFTHKAQTVASSNRKNENTASNGWLPLATTNTPSQVADQAESNSEAKDLIDAQNVSSVSEMTVYADNATIYSDNLTNKSEAVAQKEPAQTIINNTTTIDLNALSSLAANDNKKEVASNNTNAPAEKAAPKTEKKEEKSVAVKQPVKKAEKTEVASVTKVQPKPVSKTVKTTKAEPAKPQKTVYWIQVTALTSRKSADAAREVLDQNQITADVFTYKDNKDQLFYRVRVGPYTTKSEAEYWRTKIAKIETFKNNAGYITSTPVEIN